MILGDFSNLLNLSNKITVIPIFFLEQNFQSLKINKARPIRTPFSRYRPILNEITLLLELDCNDISQKNCGINQNIFGRNLLSFVSFYRYLSCQYCRLNQTTSGVTKIKKSDKNTMNMLIYSAIFPDLIIYFCCWI